MFSNLNYLASIVLLFDTLRAYSLRDIIRVHWESRVRWCYCTGVFFVSYPHRHSDCYPFCIIFPFLSKSLGAFCIVRVCSSSYGSPFGTTKYC